MTASPREIASSHRLGEAILEFMLAAEEGRSVRTIKRARKAEPGPALGRGGIPRPEAPQLPADRLLVGSEQAAEYLAISHGTLRPLTAPKGPLPVVRIGTSVWYMVKDREGAVLRMRHSSGIKDAGRQLNRKPHPAP